MESNRRILGLRRLALISLYLVIIMAGFALPSRGANAQDQEPEFTTEFYLEDCKGFRTKGVNPYFNLQPRYQLVLGEDEGELATVTITVLRDIKTVTLPEIGEIKTRVVEEVHTVNDEIVEISRNYFAICKRTNDVYYFGEAVDIFEEDGTVTHEGAWEAGQPDEDGLAEPGLIMPGTFLLGSRYYQEIADEVALDRAEHTAMGLEITVPAGTFTDCVEVTETTPLEPGVVSIKNYCRGVGLVFDDGLELISYGFVKPNDGDDDGDGDND